MIIKLIKRFSILVYQINPWILASSHVLNAHDFIFVHIGDLKYQGGSTMLKRNQFYRFSSYSFHRNFYFLNLEIIPNSNSYRDIWIFCLTNYFFVTGTVQGRKLFKDRNYISPSSFHNDSLLCPESGCILIVYKIAMVSSEYESNKNPNVVSARNLL